MADYISRDNVLRKFIEGDGDDEFTKGYNFAVNEYREKIKAMSAANVQPINQLISCKEISLKVYFYDDNGYEVFTRIYHVESVPYLIKVLFETLFTNSNVYSYYIEKVDTE